MRSLYITRGPLCRRLLGPTSHIIKRHKFNGRTDRLSPVTPADRNPLPGGLPDTAARTRFAPSPTGFMHIGSLRTALYNYLLAKATGGQFILRIEDTDRSRTQKKSENSIYEDLKWAGLGWDEGPGVGGPYEPYKQSERLETYTKYAAQLLNTGHAYRCFCTPEALDKMRRLRTEANESTMYNGACRQIPRRISDQHAASGDPYCIRFRSGHPPPFHDLVYGKTGRLDPVDDFIIIKRDGFPTYHFANVVDDYLMKITHVIRGVEWLVSTPMHLMLYKAFGWNPPQFAHVGLLVDENGRKLSKRESDAHVSDWRERGILPIALLNHILLLGWSPRQIRKKAYDVMDINEMIKEFKFRFTRGNTIVNDKYKYLQKVHLKRAARSENWEAVPSLVPLVTAHIQSIEDVRAKTRAERASKEDDVPGDDDPVLDILEGVEPLLPLARAPDGTISEQYVARLLQADFEHFEDVSSFVKRNEYFFWGIPRDYLALLLPDRTLVLHTSRPTNDGERTPSSMGKKRHTIPELLNLLHDELKVISDDDSSGRWEHSAIHEAIGPLLNNIHMNAKVKTGNAPDSQGELDNRKTAEGYRLARWAINASAPGPSIALAMVLLGKAETMRRIDTALEIAVEAQRAAARNKGKKRKAIYL